MDITDEELDGLLRKAVVASFEKELAQIPPDEELRKMYTFSDRHNTRMKKLFRRKRTRIKLPQMFYSVRAKTAGGYLRAAVAVVAVVFALSFGLLLTSQPVRAAVATMISQWFDSFTRFSAEDMGEGSDENISPDIWRPEFLPAGFAEQETMIVGDITQMVYANDAGVGITLTYSADSTMVVNNDDIQYDAVTVGGVKYHIFMSTDELSDNAIVWMRDSVMFELHSQISADTLMAVAQSVKK
ncbi:MAG: DUF4367 domain-containing protein [Oscillospiraceae bacterium]|jgi:hypothetical protein|nr:DUF4367 domain-containing protein [Oscillospiraceae bacterium]